MIENTNTNLGQLADMLATGLLTIRGRALIPSAVTVDCGCLLFQLVLSANATSILMAH